MVEYSVENIPKPEEGKITETVTREVERISIASPFEPPEIYELVFTCSILVMIAVILILIFKIIDLGRINQKVQRWLFSTNLLIPSLSLFGGGLGLLGTAACCFRFSFWQLFVPIAFCDAAEPWQLGFQDAATPMMQGIIDLHHDILVFLIIILISVLWILIRTLWHFHYQRNPIPERMIHGTTIEIIWTIFPSFVLMFIAIPSFALLYSMDQVIDPAITIKAIGHQWYWTYEYSDYNSSDEQSLTFDSYMIPEDDLELGQLRLLEVDNRVVVPAKTHLRMIITSADVLHSWAVPSLGVKCDAVPGRLNQTSIFIQREGVYYGQCSEICGTNHAFMPIVVEVVSKNDYLEWVSNQ